MSQLASLHLSKNNPTLERQTPNRVAPFKQGLVANTVTGQFPAKPKLSDLAKISLGYPNQPKSIGTNIGRPSLSELARVNLQPQNGIGVHAHRLHRPLANQLSNTQPEIPNVERNFDLALALRSKCAIAEGRKSVRSAKTLESLPNLPIAVDSSPLDMSLVCNQASPLGRVIVTDGQHSKTLFPRFKRSVMTSNASVSLKPFEFTTPSPDDVIKSRLRVI